MRALKFLFDLIVVPGSFSIEGVLQELNAESLQISDDLGAYVDSEVKPIARLVNSKVSIFYFFSEKEGEVRESLDVIQKCETGGLHAFYVDGRIVRWIRNGLPAETSFSSQDKDLAERLLKAVKFKLATVVS